MGRADVRAAVAAYLTDEAVPNLIKVHPTKPRTWAQPSFLSADPSVKSTAAGFVYIVHVDEQREANGKKSLHYIVDLQLVFRTQYADPDDGIADFDTLIDGIKDRLRAKPPLGVDDGSIFEAAEHQLEDDSDLTRDTAAIAQTVRALVRFDVSEWLNA